MMTMRQKAARLMLALVLGNVPFAMAATAPKIEPALLSTVQQVGRAEFVIVLADKADLSAVALAKTKAEKGAATVAVLKAAANRSQSGLTALLNTRGMKHQNYWIANAITTEGTLADLNLLAARADVASLHQISSTVDLLSPYIAKQKKLLAAATLKAQAENYAAKALGDPEPGVALLHAPEVWAMGFTGQGVVVGDHDIGVQWDHPALKKKYRGWDEATQTASHAYNWLNAFGALDFYYCPDATVPCDPNQHGTHTTGTMVGDDEAGNRIGVAPGAEWMACRSLLDDVVGAGTVPTYMTCMQWMMAPYPDGDTASADVTKAPDVVNNSWGCLEACAPPILKDINDATFAAGIMQVVSAGNDGNGGVCGTIISPLAVYESSFTVGASDVTDDMADFSSLGPILDDASFRLKPNITAPGVSTRSSIPNNDYGNLSGTSMAGPHVAGLAALLISAEPRLKGRVMDMRTLIERTAIADVKTTATASTCGGTDAATIPNNIFGYGRVDALAAVVARPQLTMKITAPATAKVGEDFSVIVEFTQPASGKIDATNVLYDVNLQGAQVLVDCIGCTSNPQETDRSFKGSFEKLAPGESDSIELVLRGATAGDLTVTAATEADQVSLVAPIQAKTLIGSGSTPTTPTTPGVTDASVGRFGGSFGFGVLALLGFGALRRRRS